MNFSAVCHEVHDGKGQLVDEAIVLRVAKVNHAGKKKLMEIDFIDFGKRLLLIYWGKGHRKSRVSRNDFLFCLFHFQERQYQLLDLTGLEPCRNY